MPLSGPIYDPLQSAVRYRVTQAGVECEQRAIVSGFSDPDVIALYPNYPAQCAAAINFIGTQIGDNFFGTDAYVEEIEAAPYMQGQNKCIIVSYIGRERSTEMTFSGGASAQQEESAYDKDGNLMTITHNSDTQTVEVPKYLCTYQKSVTRVESGPTMGATLEDRALEWVGKVDSGSYSWLCTELTFSSNDAYNWTVNYSWLYKPDTWEITIFHRDKQGRPTQGATPVKKRIYKTANFSPFF